MAELADAQDLGSCVLVAWRFESSYPHIGEPVGDHRLFLFVTKNQPRSYDKSSVWQAAVRRDTWWTKFSQKTFEIVLTLLGGSGNIYNC